jgi:hypothetical protein
MPRPIKWGGRLKGNLSELQHFSGPDGCTPPMPKWRQTVVEWKILKTSCLKESESLEMARAELPPGLSYLNFLPS